MWKIIFLKLKNIKKNIMYFNSLVLLLFFTNVLGNCPYTNIRYNLIDLGKNKEIDNFDCNNGDFICTYNFNGEKDGKNYYTCNKYNKWQSGRCGFMQYCKMDKNAFGCACH